MRSAHRRINSHLTNFVNFKISLGKHRVGNRIYHETWQLKQHFAAELLCRICTKSSVAHANMSADTDRKSGKIKFTVHISDSIKILSLFSPENFSKFSVQNTFFLTADGGVDGEVVAPPFN